MFNLTKQKEMKDFRFVEDDNGWEILGPGGGGSIFFPEISPFSDDVLALASDMTGTFFSYDRGLTWSMKCIKSRVDSIAFDPANEGVVYAGSSGLFKSNDNGHNWELVFPSPDDVIGEKFVGDEALHFYLTKSNIWPGGKVQKIEIDKDDPSCIYIGVATGTGLAYTGDELLIYKSMDSGKSWCKVTKIEGKLFGKIYINNLGKQYKSNVFVFSDKSACMIDGATDKVTELNYPDSSEWMICTHAGLDAGLNPDTGEIVFYTAVNPKFDDNIFVPSAYRSTDYCKTWQEMSGLDMDYNGPANGQFRRFRSIGCCPTDARKVYMGVWTWPEMRFNPQPLPNYKGIIVSDDLGENWHWSMKIGFALPDNMECGWYDTNHIIDWVTPPMFITVSYNNPHFAFILSMGTVFITEDGGATWKQRYCQRYEGDTYYGNGLEVTGANSIHFDPIDKNNVLITYSDIGLMRSSNAGKTWEKATTGVPFEWINTCYQVEFDPEIKGKAWGLFSGLHNIPRENRFKDNNFYKYGESGICITKDTGKSWTISNAGIPDKYEVPRSLALDPRSPAGKRTLYIACCGGGVYKSIDDGKSWAKKNSGIESNLYSLKILLMPDGVLYLLIARVPVGTDNKILDGAIYKSTDGAESWKRLQLPEFVNSPNDIDYDADGKTLYLGCWPRNDQGCNNKGGVYKSTDGGKSWKCVFDPEGYVYGVTTDKDTSGVLFITTFQNTICRSDDSGASWKQIKGYDFKWNLKVFLDSEDKDKIYVATFGTSVLHGPNEVEGV